MAHACHALAFCALYGYNAHISFSNETSLDCCLNCCPCSIGDAALTSRDGGWRCDATADGVALVPLGGAMVAEDMAGTAAGAALDLSCDSLGAGSASG